MYVRNQLSGAGVGPPSPPWHREKKRNGSTNTDDVVRRRWETLECFENGNVSHNDVVLLLYFGQVNASEEGRAQQKKRQIILSCVIHQYFSDAYRTH